MIRSLTIMQRTFALFLLTLVVASYGKVGINDSGSSDLLPDLEPIKQAYLARSQAQPNVSFVLDETSWVFPGALNEINRVEDDRQIPTEAIELKGRIEFLKIGESMRGRYVGEVLLANDGIGTKLNKDRDYAFHNGKGVTFRQDLGRVGASISAEDPVREGLTQRLSVTLNAFDSHFFERPSLAVLRMEEEETGELIVVGNTDFLDPNKGDLSRRELWVDPEMDYLPIEYRILHKSGDPHKLFLFSYHENEQGQYVLDAVEGVQRDGSTLSRMFFVDIHDVNFSPEVTADSFKIEIPVGTLVVDWITNTRYIVEERGKSRS